MRMVEKAVYRIYELEGEARERAFAWVREEMAEFEVGEFSEQPDDIMSECPKCNVTADDLKQAAEKVGHCYAFDLVDELLNRHAYHGRKEAKYVRLALGGIAREKIESMYNHLYDFFPDADVIAMAEANEWEFNENGNLY